MEDLDKYAHFPYELIEGEEGEELIQSYINKIIRDSKEWDCLGINVPWFRGQSDARKSPVPAVFRITKNGQRGKYDESWLSTTFCYRAPSFGDTPEDRSELDKWLFLMQHVGIPTRLLDWTENALAALFFAVNDQTKTTNPAIWMINPVALNHISLGINEELKEELVKSNTDCFPNTWVRGSRSTENIRLAFMHPEERLKECKPSENPIAIQLTYCHPRMSAQKGCFTVHGTRVEGFEEIFDENSNLYKKGYFKKYVINRTRVSKLYEKLKTLGMTHSSISPDIFGLAKELKERFWYPEVR